MRNRSRRSMANLLVNKFINHRKIHIIGINISEAGNFEIHAHSVAVYDCDIKLRVNMTTLTYAFEFYTSQRSKAASNTSTKRKPLDTSLNVDPCFLYHCLIDELKEAGLYRDIADIHKRIEQVHGSWLTPSEQAAALRTKRALYDAGLVNDIAVKLPKTELDAFLADTEHLLNSVGTNAEQDNMTVPEYLAERRDNKDSS